MLSGAYLIRRGSLGHVLNLTLFFLPFAILNLRIFFSAV